MCVGKQAIPDKAEWVHVSRHCMGGSEVIADALDMPPRRSLPGQGLTGQLPLDATIWSALPEVQSLDVKNNALNGYVPPQLSGLAGAQSLDLSNNQLQGPLPPLANMSALESVTFANNQLTGARPPIWNACRNRALAVGLTGEQRPKLLCCLHERRKEPRPLWECIHWDYIVSLYFFICRSAKFGGLALSTVPGIHVQVRSLRNPLASTGRS